MLHSSPLLLRHSLAWGKRMTNASTSPRCGGEASQQGGLSTIAGTNGSEVPAPSPVPHPTPHHHPTSPACPFRQRSEKGMLIATSCAQFPQASSSVSQAMDWSVHTNLAGKKLRLRDMEGLANESQGQGEPQNPGTQHLGKTLCTGRQLSECLWARGRGRCSPERLNSSPRHC